MADLDSLEFFNKINTPSDLELIHYMFFEKGISLLEFNKLPIPYILSIIRVNNYFRKQEEKELKRRNR